ncbi:MAG: hypothetical protein E7442_04065 [Ruminococcaceae bacterium]|nr:hypothetical protein [Oscillospiraceae bacterium]
MGECLIMRRGGETYKPAILNAAYPQNVTKTVIKGSSTSATFSVQIAEAGNPAEYTYQWYKDGTAVSGASSSSYTITGLTSTATHTVYCEVTNKGGTVQSRIATLKVTQQYTPVLNSSYPANITGAEVGSSATFKVTIATAGVPDSYTYQWYVNGSAVSGATNASYTRSNLAKGSYTVYCKVTNAAGTVQSRTATLTVTKKYLYKNGDKCSGVTGGWTMVKDSNGTGAFNSDHIALGYTGSSGRNAAAYTVNKVSTAGFSTMKVKVNITTSGGADYYGFFFGVSTQKTNVKYEGLVAYTRSSTKGEQTLSLSLSSYQGSYYACVTTSTANVTVSEVWLE